METVAESVCRGVWKALCKVQSTVTLFAIAMGGTNTFHHCQKELDLFTNKPSEKKRGKTSLVKMVIKE
jgi:hypothetical protein